MRTESLVASINMTVSEIVIRDMPPEKSPRVLSSAECAAGFATKGLGCFVWTYPTRPLLR